MVDTTQTPQQRSVAIQEVIKEAKAAEDRIVEARKQTTVFFQFADGTREQAKELSAALKSQGYIVPGEDREGGAAGKHEVRYFHEQDQPAAERLAADTTQVLRDQGYPDREELVVAAESYASYRGKKPRYGVIELWLELPVQ